jgi:hypothetical protein
MPKKMTTADAATRFVEVADSVFRSGEPVLVEQDGEPRIFLAPAVDLEAFERFREGERRANEFSRRLARLARSSPEPEPTEEEIVEAVRQTREEIYRERYGRG